MDKSNREIDIEYIRKAVVFSDVPVSLLRGLASLYLDSLSTTTPDEAVSIISSRRNLPDFDDMFLRAVREGLILGSLSLWIEDKTLISDYLMTKSIEDELNPKQYANVRSDFYHFGVGL